MAGISRAIRACAATSQRTLAAASAVTLPKEAGVKPATVGRRGRGPEDGRRVQWAFLGCPGEILEGVTNIDLVINLKLREEVVVARCLGRRMCSQCGGNFNVASIDIEGENGGAPMHLPPLLPPPQCESKLITRADDTEEVVKNRLRVYHDLTEPVEGFYRARQKLLEFNIPGGIPESWRKLLEALNIEDSDNMRSAAA
ncbi:Adenylate kinase 1 chloroplastic [Zea mays]|uniref:adenylate kinase n=1 Tax=Zea mays TaxID=4577 RepID=A0A1D6DU14_MAIZE|nr:Adenylate kinase 1 chloroplastic [Zea mays]